MNICLISLDYPTAASGGGVGSQTRTLGQALAQAGHRVTVIALEAPGTSRRVKDGGVRVIRAPQGNLHWYAYKLPELGPLLALAVREMEVGWAVLRRVRLLHQRAPFDLIEGAETGALGVALSLPTVPLVIRLHGEHYTFHRHTPDMPLAAGVRLSRALQRAAMRRARLLIAPSYAHAREIAAELGPQHPPIEVVPNAVALPIVDGLHIGAEAPFPPSAPVVLYVGRLERVKGVPVLLEAARHVLRSAPNTQFVLAGARHPSLAPEEIERLMQRPDLQGRVHLLGHVPRERLAAWYRRATLCVLPSYYESFGLAALEALAHGVPVVATTAGGLPEVVEEGVTGLLAPPGDAAALAERIVRLLRDGALCHKMALAGPECVSRRFDLGRVLECNLSLYRRALA